MKRKKPLTCGNCGYPGYHEWKDGKATLIDHEYCGPEVAGLQCCGVGEVNGLDGLVTVRDVLRLDNLARQDRKGVLLATAAVEPGNDQRPRGALLEKGGFKKVVTFKNPNTGNQVTLYMKVIRRKRGKK